MRCAFDQKMLNQTYHESSTGCLHRFSRNRRDIAWGIRAKLSSGSSLVPWVLYAALIRCYTDPGNDCAMDALIEQNKMADLHNYCKLDIENRIPSFLIEHGYTRPKPAPPSTPPQPCSKRPRCSPSGHTPQSKRRPENEPLKEITGSTRTPWSVGETAALMEHCASTRVHSTRFWEDTCQEMNKRFSTSRTALSCRLRYKRMMPTSSTTESGLSPLRYATQDVSTQTEPVIPIYSYHRTRQSSENAGKDSSLSDKYKVKTSPKLTPAATLLHDKAKEFLIDGKDADLDQACKMEMLKLIFNSQSLNSMADCVYSNEKLKRALWIRFLKDMAESSRAMCERRSSYLYHKDYESLASFSWSSVIQELVRDHGSLCQVFLAYTLTPKKFCEIKHLESLVKILGFVYGCLMKARWKDLSVVQRVVSMVMKGEKVHQKVFDKLQPLNVCVSHMVTSSVLDTISGHFQDKLVDCVKQGKKFRLVGDNVNFAVDVSHLRKSAEKKKTMEHWFGSAAIIQEIDFSSLSPIAPQCVLFNMSAEEFLPSKKDWVGIREDYTILILRILTQHVPAFKCLKEFAPDVIVGEESDRLRTKNTVIPLPVLPKNEQTYSDVVDVLDHYESLIKEVYGKAGVELEDHSIHIGGDQLTRERFSGAKRLRAFAQNAADPLNKFPHLSPITFELFHLQMTVLAMMYAKLYNEKSTETGTIGAEKIRLGRNRADGNDVKCHFMDCSELAVSLTDAYIVEAASHYFGMSTVHDHPTKNVDKDLSLMSHEEKAGWVKQSVGNLVDTMVLQDTKKHIVDKPMSNVQQITVVMPDGTHQILQIPVRGVTKSSFQQDICDDYPSYARNVLEIGLLFKDLSDCISCPDRDRMLRILKYCMIMLKGHNNRSKYALEILRFLFHQQSTLSPQSAHESFYGLFVNTSGKFSFHIPADMQMEHIVKLTKSHIRAVHSNKCEKTIIKRTASFACLSTIAENFDDQTGVILRAQKHKVPSSFKDEEILIQNLRRIKPFQCQPGRRIMSVTKSSKSPVCNIMKTKLTTWIRENQLNYSHEIGK